MGSVVGNAVAEGKLKGRQGKNQFEIFSADFFLDRGGTAWFIEFNFGPVLFDPLAGQPLTTNGLREYQRLYEANGDAVEVNDHVMIGDAIQMVFYPEEAAAKRFTLWDLAGQFQGSANADDAAQSNSVSALARSLSAMMRG